MPWSCDQPPSVTTRISIALVSRRRMTTARVAFDSALSRLGWTRTVSAIDGHNTLDTAFLAPVIAGVAGLVDARGLGPRGCKGVGVRVPPPASTRRLRRVR